MICHGCRITISPEANSNENTSKGIKEMDTNVIKMLTKLTCEDKDLFIEYLRRLCAEQDTQDKKEPASSAHPTAENT